MAVCLSLDQRSEDVLTQTWRPDRVPQVVPAPCSYLFTKVPEVVGHAEEPAAKGRGRTGEAVVDDAGGVSDPQTLQTGVGGHCGSNNKNEDETDARRRTTSLRFTQKDVSASTDVSPPLLQDEVKLLR